MTMAFNRAVAVQLQIAYQQGHDVSMLKEELADLEKEMTWHEKSLSARVRSVAEEAYKKNPKPLQDKVYFAVSESGRVKIGYTTTSLKTRLSAIQNGNPEKIEMKAVIYGGTYSTESRLHRMFQVDRLTGEWFSPSKEMDEIIAAHPVTEKPPEALCECMVCKPIRSGEDDLIPF